MERITKSYGDNVVLHDADFFVGPGERVALLGANGSGKTTLLRIAAGLIRPDSGTVRLNGVDMLSRPVDARRLLGYIPQKVGFPDTLSAIDILRFFARLKDADEERIETVVIQLGLEAFIGKRPGQLSGGMLQRLALAVTLLSEPKVLLLDEPTVGLDHDRVADLHRLLFEASERGCAVVLATHKKDDVDRFAQRFAVVHQGAIAANRTYADTTSSVPAGALIFGGGI